MMRMGSPLYRYVSLSKAGAFVRSWEFLFNPVAERNTDLIGVIFDNMAQEDPNTPYVLVQGAAIIGPGTHVVVRPRRRSTVVRPLP